MQRGSIIKRNGSWLLRYREPRVIDGKVKKVRAAIKLAQVSEEYPTKRSVLLLADKILHPLNSGHQVAESSLTVKQFINTVYLPHVKKTLRASTYKDYSQDIFEKHIKLRLGDVRLKDFRTVTAQRILKDIAEKNDGKVNHTTLLRIKSFLSGAFKHARREGFIDSPNPIVDVSVQGRPRRFGGEQAPVYAIEDIVNILDACHNTPADLAVCLAAFQGLRQSELRGLRWGDYDGVSLSIKRTLWRRHVNEPKTEASGDTIPVLPMIQEMLNVCRTRLNPAPDDYILLGSRGAPLNLANLARRVVKPALDSFSEANQTLVKWRGWHAFRRSLASNLYSIGVEPKVIQAILRHKDIGTTLAYYVRTPDNQMREALNRIENWVRNF